MNFKCSYDELVEVHKLVPHPRNPNIHPPKQIDRLAKIIDYQGQRSPIVICNETGYVIVGHGRLEALKKLGWQKAAVNFQNFDNDAQRFAHMTADNAIAEWAELNLLQVKEEILDLEELPIDLLGIERFEINDVKEPKKIELLDEGDKYLIVIECADESDQADLFNEFQTREIQCKLMS